MRILAGASVSAKITVPLVLSLIGVSYVAYRPFLGNFFTAADTLTLIETGRVESPTDFLRIFTTPLMGSTDFLNFATFYRPITVLSFSLNYFLFELTPFGYHLTNLLLHTGVTVAVFFLMRALGTGLGMAWLTALLFAVHPIIVETVPAISRRQDILVALFLSISMLLFLRSISPGRHRRGYLALSLAVFTIALGSKEVAAIFPFLIFSYLGLKSYSGRGTALAGFVEAMRGSFPFFLATLLFVVWRSYVLGGFGGYANHHSGIGLRSSLAIVKDYFLNLLAPVPAGFFTVQVLGAFLLALYLAQFYAGRQSPLAGTVRRGFVSRALSLFLAAAVPILLLTVVLNPLLVDLFAPFIERAHGGEGPGFLVSAMGGRQSHPVDYYVGMVEFALRLFSVLGALLGMGLLALLKTVDRNGFSRLLESSVGTDTRRLAVFFSIWVLLPLGIFLATQTFYHYCGYISVIPTAALLALGLSAGARSTFENWKDRGGFPRFSNLSFTRGGVAAISGCLCLYLVSYSPLFRSYGEWEDSGMILSECLDLISQVDLESCEGSVFRIEDLPWGVASYDDEIPRAKLVTYLQDYSIESWLALTRGLKTDVSVESMADVPSWPVNLSLTTKEEYGGAIRVAFVYD